MRGRGSTYCQMCFVGDAREDGGRWVVGFFFICYHEVVIYN